MIFKALSEHTRSSVTLKRRRLTDDESLRRAFHTHREYSARAFTRTFSAEAMQIDIFNRSRTVIKTSCTRTSGRRLTGKFDLLDLAACPTDCLGCPLHDCILLQSITKCWQIRLNDKHALRCEIARLDKSTRDDSDYQVCATFSHPSFASL